LLPDLSKAEDFTVSYVGLVANSHGEGIIVWLGVGVLGYSQDTVGHQYTKSIQGAYDTIGSGSALGMGWIKEYDDTFVYRAGLHRSAPYAEPQAHAWASKERPV